MGKRNKTYIYILKNLSILYYIILIVAQITIPFFIHSDNIIYKMAINFNFLTYCLSNAIFSQFGIIYLVIYFSFFIMLVISFIMIIKRKSKYYYFLVLMLAIEIVFFVTHLDFYDIPLSLIGLIFKLIGCVILCCQHRTQGDG